MLQWHAILQIIILNFYSFSYAYALDKSFIIFNWVMLQQQTILQMIILSFYLFLFGPILTLFLTYW